MVKDGQRCQGWLRMVKGAKDGQGWSKMVKDGQVSRCQSRWSALSSTRIMEKQFQDRCSSGCSDDGPHWSEKSTPNEMNFDFETSKSLARQNILP